MVPDDDQTMSSADLGKLDDDEACDPIDALAAEYLDLLRGGSAVDIDVFANEHPEHADEIREFFPTLMALEELKEDEWLPPSDPGTPEQVGDFRLLREIGRGGMGVVYEAEQITLTRRVAVKFLDRVGAEAQARFKREATLAARLEHPHIVPIYAYGDHEGRPWYAMQLVRGVGWDRLREELSRERAGALGGVSTRRTGLVAVLEHIAEADRQAGSGVGSAGSRGRHRVWARLCIDVARALDHAHQQGVLHRDIKPANLLLDAGGRAWITDFGLAKSIDGSNITKSDHIAGTLRYIAPEQLRGLCDARSDIYALGLSLHEMLALHPVFGACDSATLIQVKMNDGVAPIRHLVPGIDPDLAAIVDGACQVDPDRRPTSAALFADQLQAWLDGEAVPMLKRRRSYGMVTIVAAVLLAILATLFLAPLVLGPPRVPGDTAAMPDDGPQTAPAPTGSESPSEPPLDAAQQGLPPPPRPGDGQRPPWPPPPRPGDGQRPPWPPPPRDGQRPPPRRDGGGPPPPRPPPRPPE